MKRHKEVPARKYIILIACLLLGVLADAFGLAQVRGLVSADASSQRRVALVVGNNAYTQMRLENAVNDARAMHQTLGQLGFEVQKVEDAKLVELAKAVDAFIGRLGAGDVGLFFYAGHEIQIEGENYLVPIDFEAPDETVAKYKSYPAELVRERMEKAGARLNIIVLDACRNNPFKMSRSASRGLAAMNSGRGTLIAFATGPGKTASDSSVGRNGLFTHHLIECLGIPGLSLDQVFNRARAEVDKSSSHEQTPWVVSSVIGDFSFLSGGSAPTPKVAEIPSPTPSVGIDYSDLEQLAAKRQQWTAFMREMKTGYDKARQLDESSDLKPPEKVLLWQRFLDSYQAPNSQDDEDKRMRDFASSRIKYWKELPPPKPITAVPVEKAPYVQPTSIVLDKARPSASARGVLMAPGNGSQNHTVCSIDTSSFLSGGTLTISIDVGNGESNASFDLFPEGMPLPTTGRPNGTLAGAYDVSRGTKSRTITYKFTKGQVFQFGAEGNWFSRKDSTNDFSFTATVVPQ
jgi:uncharacterized caspase-like protein